MNTSQTPITAIDILLEPDDTMLRYAQANNARLLEAFPKGFSLDEAHRPHITLIQRFVRTENLDQVYIEYVSTFVPKHTGKHFSPHVTTGVAPTDYLDEMLAEPFEPFTFSPVGAAVYQLGPFGTAAKKLKEWDLK